MNTSLQTVLRYEYREKILAYLKKFLKDKLKEFHTINTWGEDVVQKIIPFMTQGKMLRGSLVFFSYSLFAKEYAEEILSIATALELFHSALLIHDDIMDQDEVRRGAPSMFAQYEAIGEGHAVKNTRHFGESMGICFGDIVTFLAYELLSKTSSPKIIEVFSQELSFVVLAQMQDIYQSFSAKEITREEILTIYTYKTGRYTFSLPLMTGAIFAEQPQSTISTLKEIGILLGIVFQIKDDELGLLGNSEELGKSLGSDIRENKKTLLRFLLWKGASIQQQRQLQTIFGKKELTQNDFDFIYDIYKKLHISKEIQEITDDLEKKAKESIQILPIEEDKKNLFLTLLVFNRERKK